MGPPVGDADDEVQRRRQADAHGRAAHDVQRRVSPEVDPRRALGEREQQHHDLPPPAHVRPQQDRSRHRAARSAALEQCLDQPAVHEQRQPRKCAQRQSEPPPAQHQRRDGDQPRHPEDAHQLEGPQHRLPGRRPRGPSRRAPSRASPPGPRRAPVARPRARLPSRRGGRPTGGLTRGTRPARRVRRAGRSRARRPRRRRRPGRRRRRDGLPPPPRP